MEDDALDPQRERIVALEEGFRAFVSLDKLRIAMLNEAVEWICELTGMQTVEVRRDLATYKGKQVGQAIGTIKAVREVISSKVPPKS
jgi:hypothetical protein